MHQGEQVAESKRNDPVQEGSVKYIANHFNCVCGMCDNMSLDVCGGLVPGLVDI